MEAGMGRSEGDVLLVSCSLLARSYSGLRHGIDALLQLLLRDCIAADAAGDGALILGIGRRDQSLDHPEAGVGDQRQRPKGANGTGQRPDFRAAPAGLRGVPPCRYPGRVGFWNAERTSAGRRRGRPSATPAQTQ
jgi:hypothetical protein